MPVWPLLSVLPLDRSPLGVTPPLGVTSGGSPLGVTPPLGVTSGGVQCAFVKNSLNFSNRF